MSSPADRHEPAPRPDRKLAVLGLTALGIVYGDIGTSPLYALRECFTGEFGVEPSHGNVLGVLSLVFWSLTAVVSIKYLGFVLRADNHGEGGVIALTALLRRPGGSVAPGHVFLFGAGLFAASLLYGDVMITPAISVLSAVEGLTALDPGLERWVLPVTLAILVGLFAIQHKGTARVGAVFGPVMLIWFATIGALGLIGIAHHPEILRAVAPWHAVRFLSANGHAGFLVLGAVFLVVTGAEALYADMGHFGLRPVRLAWWSIVLPGLFLSYFGQGALILASPAAAADPFFGLAPGWMLVPLIALSTFATIIASQAVISGAFSLTRQAIHLGLCPRMSIVQTSAVEIGQVYVPQVNWLLMLSTVGLVLGFRSSGALAAAYGVAVTSTMLITTILFCVIAVNRFRWNRALVGLFLVVYIGIDLSFFGANVSKIFHGAWFPLVIGAVVFVAMTTWRKGRALLREKFRAQLPLMQDFVRTTLDVPRVEGKAVFLTGDADYAPPSILHNLKHNRVLHEQSVFLNVETEEVPRVPRDEKVRVTDLGAGFHLVLAHFGFAESPNVPYVLALAAEQGLELPLDEVTFFLSRERLLAHRRPELSRWRSRLFSFLSRNSTGATAYFGIPPAQVLEIGSQVQL